MKMSLEITFIDLSTSKNLFYKQSFSNMGFTLYHPRSHCVRLRYWPKMIFGLINFDANMPLVLNPTAGNSTNQQTYCWPLTSYEIYLMVKTLDWSDLPLTKAVAPFGQNDTGPKDHLIRVIFLIKNIYPKKIFWFLKARSILSL